LRRLQSIQVLRGLAVLAVVISHCTNLRIGRAGVDLFFCISGFVMAGQMARTPTQFALDRFTRIYPPFVAALGLFFVAHPMIPHAGPLMRSLLLVPDLRAIYLYPAWSLGYEAIFYIACIASMLVGDLAVLFGFAALFVLHAPYVGSAFVLEFLAGFAIARKAWWSLPLLLAAATTDHRVLAYGTAAALILWASVNREDLFDALGPIALIGDASYSIYLTHTIVGAFIVTSWPLIVAGCIGFGMLFHFVIEKPLVRSVRRVASYIGGLRGRATAANALGR
jgi:exopolysaccharide production protein ExoZ